MKRFLFAAVALLSVTLSAQAYVLSFDDAFRARRWNLITPQAGVSTNAPPEPMNPLTSPPMNPITSSDSTLAVVRSMKLTASASIVD